MMLRASARIALAIMTAVPLCSVAGVLPEERADALYHYYNGDNVEIDGPSILLRKNFKQKVSVFANYYVDSISSASIDVVTTGASPYTEERKEYSVGTDFLHEDTLMGIAFTDSEESDYSARSLNIGISQDMFGGMTTLTMGYARGDDVVRRNGPGGVPDPTFREEASRRNYRLGLTQVVTRNMLLALNYEAVTDEGFLNNPYRSVRYVDLNNPGGFSFEPEVYPRTRSSNAVALRTRYHMPWRGATYAGVRYFSDTWGIDAYDIDIGYTHPVKQAWMFDIGYRYYTQGAADFYSDLFPYESAQNFLARDKELSTFSSQSIRFGISYNLIEDGWRMLDRATINLTYDYMFFDYEDFRDLRYGTPEYLPGQEPLFNFSADVFQLFFSVWF